LKFSNHAIERMRMRGISFDPAKMESIQSAISKAAAKGAKKHFVAHGRFGSNCECEG